MNNYFKQYDPLCACAYRRFLAQRGNKLMKAFVILTSPRNKFHRVYPDWDRCAER